MTLSEFCIRRPVFALMINLALILFGAIALTRLPVRELPDIDPPIVNVNTIYPGANAQVVETEITEKLEEEINTVEGIKKITSESREEVSSITIEFELSRDIDVAAQDVRDRVSRARGRLPDEVEEPIIAKEDGDAQAFLWIAVYSETLDTLALTDIADKTLKDSLQTVPGVSSIIVGGEKRFSIRLWLDEAKMSARGITVQDIEQVLRTQNLELPSGRVENRQREFTIQTLGELKTVDEFNRLVVRDDPDNFVRLEDIGHAEIGPEDYRSLARYNSKPSVGLGIIKQSKANTIEVAKGIKAEMELLSKELPQTVQYFIAYDESVYVEQSVKEVWNTLFIAFLLVVLTIFIFLRNVRSTLVPCVAIPVAILSTFFILYIFGFSINIITLMALVLVIGVVVDDAIVVLENIYRHIEEGEHPLEAAINGMREIIFAILVTTVSLVVVFLPMAFQTSQTGRLFIEFAITMAGAVVISSFVALTLSPMIASRILKSHEDLKHGKIFNFFERILTGMTNMYTRSLEFALRIRWVMLFLTFVLIGLAYFFYTQLDEEFLPDEDKGRFFSFILAPEGATSEYTSRMVSQAEEVLASTPEVEGFFSAVGLSQGGPGKANQGLAFVRYKDREDRDRSVQDTLGGPNGIGARFMGEIEGALAFPIVPKAIGGGFSQPVQLVLQSNNLDALDAYTQQLIGRLSQEGFLTGVRSNFEMTKPELRIRIDRDRAAALGVTVQSISRTLQILYGGLDISKFKQEGEEYDVMVQLQREERLTPQTIESLYVRNQSGELIQLSNVVDLVETSGPNSIFRYNRLRSSTIEATSAGLPLGEVVERVESILEETLPNGFRYTWAGEVESLQDTGADFTLVIILAVVVLYMVLASQFESLIHPITIMVSIPLSLLGAFGALWVLDWVNDWGVFLYQGVTFAPDQVSPFVHTLQRFVPRIPAMSYNMFTQIGLLLLVALVTKNGILLVEFAMQEIEKGKSAYDAIVAAGRIRFRPILMTSFSTIAGILPVAIGMGVGAESRRPLGVVAVGGLSVSTVLALIMVPVFFMLFARFAKKRGNLDEQLEGKLKKDRKSDS